MRQTSILPWILLSFFALIAIVLGFVGFDKLYALNCLGNCAEPRSVLDLGYLAMQLFVLDSGSVAVSGIWELEVARWLAPAVAGYALVQAALFLFADQFARLRLKRLHNHVIICGLGSRGRLFAQAFRDRGFDVVVIEPNSADVGKAAGGSSLTFRLEGSATDAEILQNARLIQAGYLIAVCGSDAVNINIATKARELVKNQQSNPLRAFIHIANSELEQHLQVHELESQASGFRLEYFNIHERGALALWRQYPAFTIESSPDNSPRLLLVGSGAIHHYLALLAGNQWGRQQENSGTKLKLLWVAPDAKQIITRLQVRYPHWAKHTECEALPLANTDDAFIRGAFLFDQSGQPNADSIYVCLDDEPECLQVGLTLAYQLREHQIPVVVSLYNGEGLAKVIANNHYLKVFPILEQTCQVDLLTLDKRERLAQAIHDNYVRHEQDKGQSITTNDSLRPWQDLPADLKDSNRQQADHIFHKLAQIGCRLAPFSGKTRNPFQFAPEEIERLAEDEHERWVQERLTVGWHYAAGEKDSELKTSPHLIPWDELSEDVKDLDRQPVREIPALLAQAGIDIYRWQ